MDNCFQELYFKDIVRARPLKATYRCFFQPWKWYAYKIECEHAALCPTWVFLVGDGLALCGERVLEDVHSILDGLPVQTNLQRVDAGRHILGQQVAWLGPQPLQEGGHLLLTQTWGRRIKTERRAELKREIIMTAVKTSWNKTGSRKTFAARL